MTLELTILGIGLIVVALVILHATRKKKVDLSFLDPRQPVDYPKEDE